MGLQQNLLSLSAELRGPLLAIDLSSACGSVCMVGWADRGVEEISLAEARPSESLAATLATAFEQSAVAPRNLAAVLVGIGPGSFTGLRVGLAMAKGLTYAAGVPVYGTSSLRMMASEHGPGWVAPIVDARHGEIFCGLYRVEADGSAEPVLGDVCRSRRAFSEALCGQVPGGEPLTIAGVDALDGAPDNAVYVTRPTVRAAWGLWNERTRILGGQCDAAATLAPAYLRVSEPERKLAGQA